MYVCQFLRVSGWDVRICNQISAPEKRVNLYSDRLNGGFAIGKLAIGGFAFGGYGRYPKFFASKNSKFPLAKFPREQGQKEFFS